MSDPPCLEAVPADVPHQPAVLVCGIGRVGRKCIEALRGYNVPVRAIELRPYEALELELPPSAVTRGDFRDVSTLLRAGIGECRSIVLVSSDTTANIEGALAARRTNPKIRLVVRGEEHGWHALLAKQLGNLVVYEPNRLAAVTFALAALDSDLLAHFYVDSHLFQVLEHEIEAGDNWLGRSVDAIHPPGRRILSHIRAGAEGAQGGPFYGWDPERKLEVGDRLLLLETGDVTRGFHTRKHAPERSARATALGLLRRLTAKPEKRRSRGATLALTGVAALSVLILLATSMLSWGVLHLPFATALRSAISLLFGGHLADLFEHYEELPAEVRWLELTLVIAGTVLTAVLYALLTDLLLRARFELRPRRPSPPTRGHVIIAGLGQTGVRIAGLLEQLECKLAGIEEGTVEAHVLPEVAIISGKPTDAGVLHKARISRARGLVAATADDQTNIEIALVASTINPACKIAVRTFDPRFRENTAFLLPEARVLCVSTLAATAYAAAALGEHVINLFQTANAPVLVVEYDVSAGDTLVERPLWQVAEGYAVVPVMLERAGRPAYVPSQDDRSLALLAGDRLVVLATPSSLEAIERGELRPARYLLRLERMRAYAESVGVVGMLRHRLGFTLEQGHTVLGQLPYLVPTRLYGRYATHTARALDAMGLETQVLRVEDGPVQEHPTSA